MSALSSFPKYPRSLYSKQINSESYSNLYGGEITDYKLLKEKLISEIPIIQAKTPSESFVGLAEVKEEIYKYIMMNKILDGRLCYTRKENVDRILLFGAIGTGKNHLARVIATKLKATWIDFTYFLQLYKWEYNLEPYTHAVHEICMESNSKLCIIYLDNPQNRYFQKVEKNAITRFITEVQPEWNKHNQDNEKDYKCRLVIIAGTDDPFEFGEEWTRVFDRRVYVPTLNLKERVELLDKTMKRNWKLGHLLTPNQLGSFAKRIRGIYGSEIERLVSKAIMLQYSIPDCIFDSETSGPDLCQEFFKRIIFRPIFLEDLMEVWGGTYGSFVTPDKFKVFESFQTMYGNGPFQKMFLREVGAEDVGDDDSDNVTKSDILMNIFCKCC